MNPIDSRNKNTVFDGHRLTELVARKGDDGFSNERTSRFNMDSKQKEKLERYLKNSSRFLWGLSRKSQKTTYLWLRNKGKKLWGVNFNFKDGSYHDIIEQLIKNPGIEKLLRDIIVPRVKEKFPDKALEFLRLSWNTGTLPSTSDLKQYYIEYAYPFLEINRQFNYVERWGEFAGVWFEEIEGEIQGQE